MQVTDACNACFEQRQTFTQEVIARVLNQLVCYVKIVLCLECLYKLVYLTWKMIFNAG